MNRADGHIFAVLGMHRSGTSWLAGTLEEKGLPFGDVNQAAPFNQKGNRENDRLRGIHASVLKRSNGSWDKVPRRIVWTDPARERLRSFIEEMSAQFGSWGFKDPRTLLLLAEWQRQVPSLGLVGVYRHPLSVARSLNARDLDELVPVPIDQGLALWTAYNKRLVDAHKRNPFPILSFDDDRASLERAVTAVAESWELPKATCRATFFEESLRHGDMPPVQKLPRSCRRIWSYLRENTLVVQ